MVDLCASSLIFDKMIEFCQNDGSGTRASLRLDPQEPQPRERKPARGLYFDHESATKKESITPARPEDGGRERAARDLSGRRKCIIWYPICIISFQPPSDNDSDMPRGGGLRPGSGNDNDTPRGGGLTPGFEPGTDERLLRMVYREWHTRTACGCWGRQRWGAVRVVCAGLRCDGLLADWMSNPECTMSIPG